MKRTNNILIAALAGIALSLFASSAQAQYKPTGDDGITASPKLRQQLDERRRNQSSNSVVAKVPQMACPKCKDEVLKTIDWTARGANKPYVTIVRHLCPGCGTEWNVVGHGKGKQSVATHKCSSCGTESASCCNTTKGNTAATKGME